MSETTTEPDVETGPEIDWDKARPWYATSLRDVSIDNTLILNALDAEEVTTVGQLVGVYDGWEPGATDPLAGKTFNLSEFQVQAVHEAVAASLAGTGLDPTQMLPWLYQPVAEPVVVEGTPAPADPIDLDAYDRETARLVGEAEDELGELEATWEERHGEAAVAKKAFENHRDKLRSLIRERKANRGKRPEKTLFDRPAEDDAATADAPSEGRLFELSQLYPLDFAHWEDLGLTAKDVEKLNEGVTKHHGTIPLRTLGDVNRYTKPNANDGYERRLTDIKGFGPGAFERWEAANLKFWERWPNGLAVKFAAEIGFDLGTQGAPADEAQPDAGGGVGGEGGDGEALAGESAATADIPPERLAPNPRTGELETVGAKPKRQGGKGKRKAAAK
jgi:hypothetical protein